MGQGASKYMLMCVCRRLKRTLPVEPGRSGRECYLLAFWPVLLRYAFSARLSLARPFRPFSSRFYCSGAWSVGQVDARLDKSSSSGHTHTQTHSRHPSRRVCCRGQVDSGIAPARSCQFLLPIGARVEFKEFDQLMLSGLTSAARRACGKTMTNRSECDRSWAEICQTENGQCWKRSSSVFIDRHRN